nr:immunoglobulin heavy chain junction region [Macaca mulatta]MOX04013.1 immunoglobulin heavy chain junction region [Macaca mulatta]
CARGGSGYFKYLELW